MYLRWLIYALVSNVINIICYITNPIVVLFCDEEGELHGFLEYWQTWDDSCDAEYYMKECVPRFLDYDYSSKYECVSGTTEKLNKIGRTRLFSKLRPDATFTFKEKVQRYFCRVLWLTRNCAYGFNFWIFGACIDSATMTYEETDSLTTKGNNGKYFILHSDSEITRIGRIIIKWKLFIGWKIAKEPGCHQAMLANRPLIVFDIADK